MKLKHTIYIILLLFTILPLFGFGAFMIYTNNRNIERIMGENLAVTSGAQILDIENFCQTRKENMAVIGELDLVHNAIMASLGLSASLNAQERDYLNNTLTSRIFTNSFSESLSIINKDFKVVASSSSFIEGETSILKNADSKFLSGDFYFSNILNPSSYGNKKQIVAAVMGIHREGKLIGYIVEEINLQFFERIRTQTNLWEDGTLYLIDGNGKMITAGDGTETSRQEFVSTKEERKEFSDAWGSIDFTKEPNGEIKYRVGSMRYITYYSTLRYTDWKIMLTVNLTSFQERKNAYMVLMITTFTAVAALLIVVNRFISLKLAKPVQGIIDTLRKVQDNQDYTLRVDNCRKDEIGVLASEVNVLLEYIERENLLEKERQRNLTIKAEHDPLTEIYNRKGIEDRIKTMLWTAGESGRSIAVVILDVDDFKDFNTNYGHPGGDRVLKFTACALNELEHGIAGRIGGDEFIAGLEGFRDQAELEHTMNELLQKLNAGFFDAETSRAIQVRCSIGVAVTGGKRCQYDAAVHKADEALYRAKENGKNTCCYSTL